MDRSRPQARSDAELAVTVTEQIGNPGDVSYLLAIVRRWPRLIASFAAGAAAIGLLYLVVATPQYASSARVVIDFRRLASLGQGQLSVNNKVNDSAVDTQTAIMASEGIVRSVVKSLKLDQDSEFIDPPAWVRLFRSIAPSADGPDEAEENVQTAIEAVQRRLRAVRVGVSYVIELRFQSEDAAKAATIVNAMTNAYLQDQLQAKQDASSSANDWYSRRVAELQTQAFEAEKAAVAYRADNQIMFTDGKYVDEQQLSELSSRLVAARTDRILAEARVAEIEAILGNGLGGAVADEFKNEVITSLRQRLGEVTRRSAENAALYGATHGSALRGKAEADQIRASLADEFRRIAAGYRSGAAVAKLSEDALARGLAELAGHSGRSQQSRVQLAMLQSLADTYKSMRDAFQSRFTEAAQERSFPITESRIVSPATAASEAVSPNATKTLLGSIAVGLGIGYLIALSFDVMSRRTRDRRQLAAAIGRPCIGVLGELPGVGRLQKLDYATREPFSPAAEGLRGVRLAIDDWAMRQHAGKAVVIGVVSALSNEGATTVASNLAGVIALGGAATLLVDMDFRKRTLSDLVATREQAADDLEAAMGGAPLSELTRRFETSALDVLSLSAWDDPLHPADRLSSKELRGLVDRARGSYRYVIVDLPPLVPVSDARIASSFIDCFVLVTKWNVTSLDDLQLGFELSPEVRRKLVGAVFNRADPHVLDTSDDHMMSHAAAYQQAMADARIAA